MIWLLLKRLVRQFPKWAFVVTVLVVSTALFGFWWFTRSAKRIRVAGPPVAVEDLGPKLAQVESKWQRLLLVDNDLYDLDSGSVIFHNWLQSGVPLRLFYDAKAKKMIAQYPQGFIRYGLNGRTEATLAKATKALSDDLKSAVFAKDGEVWRAEVDWQSFEFVNERKVTSIGQFNEANFADNILLLTEKTLVVRNSNALLRVNLDTGSVKPIRIPMRDIGKRRSPDSKWIVGTEGAQFYCYDVDADQVKTIQAGRNGGMSDFQWLGNDKCLGLAGGKIVAVYDRLAQNLAALAVLPFSCFKMGEPSPDDRFVFCAGGIDGRNGALVDLEKKTADRVRGGAGIKWVSNDTFSFSREVSDSDLRGTWLQTAGEAEKRVSPEPYLVSNAGPQMLALPSADLVVFETRNGLTKMNSDGTGFVDWVKLRQPAARVLGIQDWKTE